MVLFAVEASAVGSGRPCGVYMFSGLATQVINMYNITVRILILFTTIGLRLDLFLLCKQGYCNYEIIMSPILNMSTLQVQFQLFENGHVIIRQLMKSTSPTTPSRAPRWTLNFPKFL